MHSHEEDGSKYLKYEQIISLSEAAITAQDLSGSAISRNMLLHDSSTKTIGAEHSDATSQTRPQLFDDKADWWFYDCGSFRQAEGVLHPQFVVRAGAQAQ